MKARQFIVGILLLAAGLPLRAQYRDDQFKRDAFSQTYADTTEKMAADTSQLFSFKEYFGGIAHKRSASLKTLTMGSSVFLGGTQAYNRQYWKIPVIYGGIGAGVGLGIHYNQLYHSTEDTKYRNFRDYSYIAAGLVWWGSLLDGAAFYPALRHPDPAKSTVYSILLPGLGQINNGEFWKVPIYWGAIAGSINYYVDNNRQYKRWKWIHNMATTDDEDVVRPPQSGEAAKYYRDTYRRYRDYSVLATALFYLLQVIDANVFAYMQDFEVTDDISLHLEPAVIPSNYAMNQPAMGMSLGIKF